MVILLLALLALAVSVALAARALAAGGAPARRTIAQIAEYGFAKPPQPAPRRPSLHDRLDTLASSLGAALNRRLPREREAELRRQLYAAGMYETTPRKFLGYRVLASAGLGLGFLWLALAAGATGTALLLAAAAGAFGWVVPTFVLSRRGTRRLEQIDHEMPELVDLLVTCVEGGLGPTAALHLVTDGPGPLREEMRLVLREERMGLTVSEALRNLLGRVDTLSVRAFVQAIVQGESLGVSIGKVMRDLAKEMRKRRRQVAEERAHKAATKIAFPLVLLIFPSIFVVTLGPTLIQIIKLVGSG